MAREAALFASSGADALSASVAQLLERGSTSLLRQIEAFAKALQVGLGHAELEAAHQSIAAAAQKSVLGAYATTVTARQGPSGYRAGATDNHSRRFAGGALRRALGGEGFYRASARGIDFVNIGQLDKEAAHWYRLNFGAGSAGQGSTARYEIRWGHLVLASLGFDAAPSAPFVIPKGVWVSPTGERVRAGASPNGSDMFYPQSERGALRGRGILGRPTGARVTGGIEARNFLDAGLRRIAELLPRAYDDIYRDWFNAARRRTPTGPFTEIEVRAPAPRRLARPPRAVPGLNFTDD